MWIENIFFCLFEMILKCFEEKNIFLSKYRNIVRKNIVCE